MRSALIYDNWSSFAPVAQWQSTRLYSISLGFMKFKTSIEINRGVVGSSPTRSAPAIKKSAYNIKRLAIKARIDCIWEGIVGGAPNNSLYGILAEWSSP